MLAIVSVTVVGDYFLKIASERPNAIRSLPFLCGVLAYGASATGFVFAMRHMSLASVGVFYSVLTILMMAGLGVLVFRETLATRDLIGISLAITSLFFMARFT